MTLITYRSVVRRNIAIQAAIIERPRKVCPSVLHEKPTSPSSTRQVLRGNGGIYRARAESNIAECANERFLSAPTPFFLCPLPPELALYDVHECHNFNHSKHSETCRFACTTALRSARDLIRDSVSGSRQSLCTLDAPAPRRRTEGLLS